MSTNSIVTGFYHLRQADIWFQDVINQHKFTKMATKAIKYRNKIKQIADDFMMWDEMKDIRNEIRKDWLNE